LSYPACNSVCCHQPASAEVPKYHAESRDKDNPTAVTGLLLLLKILELFFAAAESGGPFSKALCPITLDGPTGGKHGKK
jgi:hypothetical protein